MQTCKNEWCSRKARAGDTLCSPCRGAVTRRKNKDDAWKRTQRLAELDGAQNEKICARARKLLESIDPSDSTYGPNKYRVYGHGSTIHIDRKDFNLLLKRLGA